MTLFWLWMSKQYVIKNNQYVIKNNQPIASYDHSLVKYQRFSEILKKIYWNPFLLCKISPRFRILSNYVFNQWYVHVPNISNRLTRQTVSNKKQWNLKMKLIILMFVLMSI